MKRIFYTLGIVGLAAILLVACNGKSGTAGEAMKNVSYADTVGFAEFQNWKAQNERVNAMEAYNQSNYATPAVSRTPARRSYSGTRSGSMVSSTENQAKQKKGWSKAAKGVAIGAGSGAVLGAVINKKNRALGAVIGGVIGGGVGYGIGRSQDRKDGRVTK